MEPAERGREEKAARETSAGARVAAANNAFGMPPGQDADAPTTAGDPGNVELPKGFEKFLGK